MEYRLLKGLELNKRNVFDIVSNLKLRGGRYVANTDIAWLALLRIKPPYVITNAKEWRAFRDSECLQYHILSRLGGKVVDDFERKMKFEGPGLDHVDLTTIRPLMSDDGVDEILSLFGIGGALAKDHDGYRCDGSHNCDLSNNVICMSSCAFPSDFFNNFFEDDLIEVVVDSLSPEFLGLKSVQ